MRWVADMLYLAVAIISAPVWLSRMLWTGKIRTDWRARFGRTAPLPAAKSRRILLHAVSVGEVNAIRTLVDQLAASPEHPEIVIATTTDTGFARAKALWDQRHAVVRYPFDASFAVRRFLNAVAPDVVVLIELEVWPNFVAMCHQRGIPVGVVNGRLTGRSFRRYRRIAALIRPTFRRLAFVAAQNQAYADRFKALGVCAEAVVVTGTMKWDSAQIADAVPGADALAEALGIDRSRPLVVAGSTAPEEHELLVRSVPPGVQLLCAPRKPEWFDQAAQILAGCVRRSQCNNPHGGDNGTISAHASASRSLDSGRSRTDRFLLDTIGELRQAYALADVVVVGRSFGKLYGSDMMEPVALGKPTVVGPAVDDFQDAVDALIAGQGLIQTTAAELPSVIADLLSNAELRNSLARNGRTVIRSHQGATQRNAALILSMLASHTHR